MWGFLRINYNQCVDFSISEKKCWSKTDYSIKNEWWKKIGTGNIYNLQNNHFNPKIGRYVQEISKLTKTRMPYSPASELEITKPSDSSYAWWRHQMKTLSALLAFCVGNSPAAGEFPSQRPVTRSFDVFFDLWLNKRLSKQSRRRWFRDAIEFIMTSL